MPYVMFAVVVVLGVGALFWVISRRGKEEGAGAGGESDRKRTAAPEWTDDFRFEPDTGQGAWLVAVVGNESGRTFKLGERVATIGRAPSNPIQLSDSGVSRNHSQVSWLAGQFVIVDMGSENGTHVNGERVQRHPLKDGDVITLGVAKVRFEANGSHPVDYCMHRKAVGERFHAGTSVVDLESQREAGSATMTIKTRLADVGRVTSLVQAGMRSGELLREVAQGLWQHLPADRVIFVRRKPEGGWGIVALLPSPDADRARLRLAPDKALMAKVAGLKRGMGSVGSEEDDPGIACALATPIRRGGEVVGVLYADRFFPAKEQYSALDLDYLDPLAALSLSGLN